MFDCRARYDAGGCGFVSTMNCSIADLLLEVSLSD